MSRYEVRRRIWAWDLRERRRRRQGRAIENGLWDIMILGPIGAAIWHGFILVVQAVTMVFLTIGQCLARVVAREGWPVEARFRSNGAVYRQWTAPGFRAAGLAAAELQERADRGEPLPTAGRYVPRG